MARIDEVLNRHWQELKALHPGVLNVQIAEKWVNGANTHQPSITVYVAEKLPMATLQSTEKIPDNLEDIPVDVVEFKPTTWKIGKTSISEMHPAAQKRLLGAHRNPKVGTSTRSPIVKAGQLIADWLAYCSAIQNQNQCGCCVGEGCCGVYECAYRIMAKNDNYDLLLSIAYAFFCAGGTCTGGSQPDTVLDFMVKNGVCLETADPFTAGDAGVDQPCPSSVSGPIYKLTSYNHLTDINDYRTALTTGPLVACFSVPQSFMNYVSGVYQPLANDPILGDHCTGNIGIDDPQDAYHGRNSWGIYWGEKGYFWIKQGILGFDSEAWQLVPILLPNPPPQPTPKPKNCCPVIALLRMRRKNKGGK